MKMSKLTLGIATATLMVSTAATAGNPTVGGRGILDYTDTGFDNGSVDTDSEEWAVTDARVNVSGDFGEDYSYRAEIRYNEADSGDEVDYTDLNITYKGFGENANVTVGSQKEPFGLNRLAAGTDTTFMMRSNTLAAAQDMNSDLSICNSDNAGRTIGVQVHSANESGLNYGAGLFRDDVETTGGDEEILWAFTGRVVYGASTDNGLWHAGLSYTDRDGGDTLADADALNLEGAWVVGPFSAQLEYTDGSVDAGGGDADFDGYYLNLAWTITGESRPYSNGVFGRITPEGDSAAYEVAVRFFDNSVEASGGDLDSDGFAIALNAYKNANVRVGLEFGDVETEQGANKYEEDYVKVRTQFAF